VTVVEAPRKASLLTVVKAVFWSFLGIRKRRDYASDSVELKPHQVIIAGLIGAVIFILSLILLVRFIMGNVA
jgi:hypothetical protein